MLSVLPALLIDIYKQAFVACSCARDFVQNIDSEKKVTVDGEELGQGKEKKLGIGMKIVFGDDNEWQVRHHAPSLAHYLLYLLAAKVVCGRC